MAYCKQGNILIMTLLITALTCLVGVISLKSILWAIDFKQVSFAHERSMRIAQGLLICGLERAGSDFEELCKKGTVITSTVVVDTQTYLLSLEPAKEKICASCAIITNDKTIAILKAELAKNSQKHLEVRGFQR